MRFTAASLGGDNALSAGDTLTFGNGVDLVTDFLRTEMDRLDVNGTGIRGINLLGLDFNGTGTANNTYVAYGSFSNSVFTAAAGYNETTARDALVLTSDGVAAFNAHTGWVVLTGLPQALVAADFA